MMLDEERSSSFGGIEEEHDRLRETIASMRTMLETPRPAVGDPASHAWAAELSDVLITFHDEVSHHFREEEASGFLAELERVYPQAMHRIDLLRREHDRILAEVREVLGATHAYAAGRSPENPALRRWILSILDRLTKHEQDEGKLMQKLLYTDFGQAD
jgi:iron-sulfur cluster repair protein YtfE (RIC family)